MPRNDIKRATHATQSIRQQGGIYARCGKIILDGNWTTIDTEVACGLCLRTMRGAETCATNESSE